MSQVTIVGAGVMGLSVATELVAHHISVTVIDKCPQPGPHTCSWWAGGMLAPYCEFESAELPVLELGKGAADWWQQHTGLVSQTGTLVVATQRDYGELKQFSRRTTGFEQVNQHDINQLEPDISEYFKRGLFFPTEAYLSPRVVLNKLHSKLIEHDVEFRTEQAEPKQLAQHGLTIDCRGMASKPDIAALRGVKGEMLLLRCPDVKLSRPVRLLHPRIPLYIVPRGNDVFMIGATMIESSAKKNATARSVVEMLNAAYTLNPGFGEAEILEIGVDSRPAYGDNLPKVTRHGNLISANGLFRHGYLLAPAMAQQVRKLVQQG